MTRHSSARDRSPSSTTALVVQDGQALPEELPARWRACAAELEPYNPGAAVAFRRCADEMDAALAAREEELLTLADAAEESGYSVDHLERLVREGRLPNAGRKHAPRIRRGDVPRRAGALRPASVLPMVGVSRRQLAQAVVSSPPRSSDNA